MRAVGQRALLSRVSGPALPFLAVLCTLLGMVRSLDPDSGGAPASLRGYLGGFLQALCIVLPVAVVVMAAARIPAHARVLRACALAASVVLGITVGSGLILVSDWPPRWHDYPDLLFETFWGSLPVAVLGLGVFLMYERDQGARRALLEERMRQADLERQQSEAQLQILQSQVEPHFLFNTLAHVRRLFLTAPNLALEMLRDLSHYLGTVRPALMRPAISVEEDLELGRAYLNIQQRRMGERLRLIVELAPAARAAQIPPMTITTLAENAIKHGISPLTGGGTIAIRALAANDGIRVEVSDTGVGLRGDLGSGVGLANVRSRLALLYGTRAALSLLRNQPTGVTAAITLPHA